MQFDNDVQKEYDDVERQIKEAFPDADIYFRRDVYPYSLSNESFDMYVFDYGGMMPGCSRTPAKPESH